MDRIKAIQQRYFDFIQRMKSKGNYWNKRSLTFYYLIPMKQKILKIFEVFYSEVPFAFQES